MHFNGRLRQAARLAYHCEYGANLIAMVRSSEELKTMALTEDEWVKVYRIVEWMSNEVVNKNRWF